jgi:hypothetical protein
MKTCQFCFATDEETKFDVSNKCKRCRNGISRYGLNTLQQREMYRRQDHKCAICETEEYPLHSGVGKSAVIDHQHFGSGEVRGILCPPCNALLGSLEKAVDDPSDIPDLMSKIQFYLTKEHYAKI